jgi:hypothetical protein
MPPTILSYHQPTASEPRVAEIIRYTYTGWPDADIARFQNMLTTTWEIACNHFHDRLGYSLSKMSAVLPTIRPTGVNHHINWRP